MGKLIADLLHLQTIEHQMADVRGRLRTRKNAVATQQRRIDQIQEDFDAMREKSLDKRKDADRLELDLKIREEQVTKLRGTLNTAKTNKEYAAVLTQINTSKADNAKLEDEILKAMQDVDAVKAETDKLQQQLVGEQERLQQVQAASAAEIERLGGMLAELAARRSAAAENLPPAALSVFERIAENYDGDAMAVVEVHGRKPPYEYVCGGCFMGLNAEHANVLRARDEIRRCDNCERILYMAPDESQEVPEKQVSREKSTD